MATLTKISIGEDFSVWALETADLLEQGRFDELDVAALADEIHDLGASQQHALDSQLQRLFLHLLKWVYQPGMRTPSWRISIKNARAKIEWILTRSPSLRRQLDPEKFGHLWKLARESAAVETRLAVTRFPETCPWDMDDQVLNPDWLP
jgi:hypothetical protein